MKVRNILQESFTGCRHGTWTVNSEFMHYTNIYKEPSLEYLTQRLLEVATELGEDEQEAALIGVQQCMEAYENSLHGKSLPARPSSSRPGHRHHSQQHPQRRRRSLSSMAMRPPPYDRSSYSIKEQELE